MIFTSFEFALFFLLVAGVRYAIRDFRTEKWFLVAASYAFYMSWNIWCGFLILVSSMLDYWVGLWLSRTEDPHRRKRLMVISLVANLGLLAFFKYTNFLIGNLHWLFTAIGYDVATWHYDILLPVGISFFTFQSMSYTIDVYRRRIPPCHSVRDFLLYVSFFPQLVAGPIVRAADFLPQLFRRVRPTVVDFEMGLAQFGIGAIKKMVISDQIAPHVDMIFGNPGHYDGLTLMLGVLGYAAQIYCDFSGYSDMAIGAARMMGFKFMENFQMPYSAVNITEFWRRWHISLSSWFRDYLYIPLGGNRLGVERTYFNLLVTMLLCGLWHGASWNFVVWGLFHGVGLAVHRLWTGWGLTQNCQRVAAYRIVSVVASRMITLGMVMVGWILFRAQSWDVAWEYLLRLTTWTPEGVRMIPPYIVAAISSLLLVHLVVHKDRNWAHEVVGRPMAVRIAAYGGMTSILSLFAATDAAPFIYFQF